MGTRLLSFALRHRPSLSKATTSKKIAITVLRIFLSFAMDFRYKLITVVLAINVSAVA